MSEIAPQVEVWKKIVDVQQHFNDLELRIRNFALIVTGAFIGLGGYAIKDGGTATLFGLHVSVAGLVVFCSLLPLYLMDRLWYHRLLDGSVSAATPVEARLRDMGLTIELGTKISEASPFTLFGKKVRSKHKMDWFYGLIAVGILILSMVLAFGVQPATPASSSGLELTTSQLDNWGHSKLSPIGDSRMGNAAFWLNAVGLTSGVVGTALIYFFGVPRQTDTGGVVLVALSGDEGRDDEEAERIKRFKWLGNLGLMLILAAFLLQLVSLTIAP